MAFSLSILAQSDPTPRSLSDVATPLIMFSSRAPSSFSCCRNTETAFGENIVFGTNVTKTTISWMVIPPRVLILAVQGIWELQGHGQGAPIRVLRWDSDPDSRTILGFRATTFLCEYAYT